MLDTVIEDIKKDSIEKDKKEMAFEMAIEMLKNGESVEKIAQYSKLSQSEISTLKDELKLK